MDRGQSSLQILSGKDTPTPGPTGCRHAAMIASTPGPGHWRPPLAPEWMFFLLLCLTSPQTKHEGAVVHLAQSESCAPVSCKDCWETEPLALGSLPPTTMHMVGNSPDIIIRSWAAK